MNDPVPVPLDIFESEYIGFVDVLQQIPLSVIVVPPSEVALPPEEAETEVIEVMLVVVTVGAVFAQK